MEPLDRIRATSLGGTGVATAERVTTFLRAVYGWMCAGLGITAVVAYSIAGSGFGQVLASNHLLFLVLFAAQIGSVFPHTFDIVVSITVLVIIIVGGMGSVPGVVLGAIVLIVLPNLLREFSEYQFLFYGVLLIVMMLKRPEGFIPSRRRAQELHAEELSQDAWLEIYGEKGLEEKVPAEGTA